VVSGATRFHSGQILLAVFPYYAPSRAMHKYYLLFSLGDSENLAILECGSVEVWKRADVETWSRGGVDMEDRAP
jgi:hypothetical protein